MKSSLLIAAIQNPTKLCDGSVFAEHHQIHSDSHLLHSFFSSYSSFPKNIRLANSNACKCNNSCKPLVSRSLLFFPSFLLYLSTLPSPVFRRRWENHMVRLVQSQKIMGSYSILFCLSEFHTKAESLYFQHPGNSKVFYKSTSPDSYILYGFCYLACEALTEPVVATVIYPLILPLLNAKMKAKKFFFFFYCDAWRIKLKLRTSAVQAFDGLVDFHNHLFIQICVRACFFFVCARWSNEHRKQPHENSEWCH